MTRRPPDLPTLDINAAAAHVWDVAVIGAGPAGAMAALRLAQSGAHVLLIDKQQFPRPKVCGCCLNAAALHLLAACGLPDLHERTAAQPLTSLKLAAAGRTASVPLPLGAALSRETFDTLLASEAVRAGASFLPNTSAILNPDLNETLRIELTNAAQDSHPAARVVLVADSLAGRALQQCSNFRSVIAPHARVGGSTLIARPTDAYEPGVIYMAVARGGYAGVVKLENNCLNIAIAVDIDFVRQQHGLGGSAERILADAGLPPIGGLENAAWHGAPRLTTRRTPLAATRVFLIGDAAGFVEPFTGEGMAWALATGAAVAPLALTAIRNWDSSLIRSWETRYRQVLYARQRRCRMITRLIRYPAAAWTMVAALAHLPSLARPILNAVNRPLLDPV